MSRVAKNPVPVPKGLEVSIQEQQLTLKSQKGDLTHNINPNVKINFADNLLTFLPTNETRLANAMAGTARALVNNMVKGLSEGFQRKLTLVGVGYRAKLDGKSRLELSLGFSHPVAFIVPEGITVETPSQTEIVIKGVDKQLVGQVAANIRSYRPPEPYKGKGVKYSNEIIILKETKKK